MFCMRAGHEHPQLPAVVQYLRRGGHDVKDIIVEVRLLRESFRNKRLNKVEKQKHRQGRMICCEGARVIRMIGYEGPMIRLTMSCSRSKLSETTPSRETRVQKKRVSVLVQRTRLGGLDRQRQVEKALDGLLEGCKCGCVKWTGRKSSAQSRTMSTSKRKHLRHHPPMCGFIVELTETELVNHSDMD